MLALKVSNIWFAEAEVRDGALKPGGGCTYWDIVEWWSDCWEGTPGRENAEAFVGA